MKEPSRASGRPCGSPTRRSATEPRSDPGGRLGVHRSELGDAFAERTSLVKDALEATEKSVMRVQIVDENVADGRSAKDIRPITIEVGLLPRTHGSALFTRGSTQSLGTVTLGTKQDQQMIDDLDPKWDKTFMLHYNFPPFSVGEVGASRPAAARSATARWRSGRSRACCQSTRIFLTRSGSSRTSSSPTGRRPWRRCARARWR